LFNLLLNEIENHIEKLAERKAKEFQKYHNNMDIIHKRENRRVLNPKPKVIKTPEEWSVGKRFNPFYVLKNKKKIANSIFKKLIDGTYVPHNPYEKKIKKKNSEKTRSVFIYEIPDEAVSNYLYSRLLSKNKHRFSSFSYAYRSDRNVHYAIQDIALDIKMNPRLFVAEFDFRDFFGSINHEYLIDQFNKNGFLISDFESGLIKKFLSCFTKGIDQGTSISLFLANMACWSLDKKLEIEGLRFARYADDTVIWAGSYQKICRAYEIIQEFSVETGVEINFDKSHGISLLTKKDMPNEFPNYKNYIDFLGYSLSGDNISIKEQSVIKIKKHISYLLYTNLIQPINTSPLRSVEIPSNDMDKDFLTAIMQVRRYLYGNLNENMLRNYLNGSYKRLNFKGIMSFYPLLDDEKQMEELDRWLLSTILNILRKRKNILLKIGYDRSNQFPFSLNEDNLLRICKHKKIYNKKGLFEIPSFKRIYKAVQESVITKGIEETMHPKSNKYNY